MAQILSHILASVCSDHRPQMFELTMMVINFMPKANNNINCAHLQALVSNHQVKRHLKCSVNVYAMITAEILLIVKALCNQPMDVAQSVVSISYIYSLLFIYVRIYTQNVKSYVNGFIISYTSRKLGQQHNILLLTGGIVSVATDEEGLAEYAELFEDVQSLDGLLERLAGSGTIPAATFDTCEFSAYISSNGKPISCSINQLLTF